MSTKPSNSSGPVRDSDHTADDSGEPILPFREDSQSTCQKGSAGAVVPLAVELWSVVGSCPSCGAPIYGPPAVPAGTELVAIRRSCSCAYWRNTARLNKEEK